MKQNRQVASCGIGTNRLIIDVRRMYIGVDLVPLLKVLFAHIAACCRALALSVHLRKGGRQARHSRLKVAGYCKFPYVL